ncbi:MAG TPA: hypothetical protein VH062_35900 [Polyangiaceae bacterium]|jgi:hypothetical protein|nr:hypothetical protein [Polyangiaceae bacterium]
MLKDEPPTSSGYFHIGIDYFDRAPKLVRTELSECVLLVVSESEVPASVRASVVDLRGALARVLAAIAVFEGTTERELRALRESNNPIIRALAHAPAETPTEADLAALLEDGPSEGLMSTDELRRRLAG